MGKDKLRGVDWTQAVAFLQQSTQTHPTVDELLLLARLLQETGLEGRFRKPAWMFCAPFGNIGTLP